MLHFRQGLFGQFFHLEKGGNGLNVPRSSIALKIVKATAGQVALEDLGLSREAIEKIRLKQQKLRDKKRRQKARNLERAEKTLESMLTASGS